VDRLRSWLRPGVGAGNFLTLLYGSFVSIALVVFVNIGQPYVLLENLKIENAEGQVTGNLVMAAEIIVLLSIGYIGVLNDRIGRRPVIVAGTLIMALGYAVMPLATSLLFLLLVRIVLALGTTAETSTITTIMHDYAAERARGKVIALVGMLMGIGTVLMNVVVGNLPARFVAMDFDAVTAGQLMHWVVAAVCVLSALLFRLGFRPGTAVTPEQRLGQLELVRQGLIAARRPRIALSFVAAFVSRSDLVILGTFVVLWGTVAGRARGLDVATAVALGVKVFAITQTAGLLSAPLLGALTDRVNRVTGLAICSALGAAGYLSMAFVTDPAESRFLPLMLLLGVGQTACNMGAQALVGQEAADEIRGVVIGGFGFCGTIGIIVSTWIGGILFDLWAPPAPFVFVGVLTGLVCLLSLYVRYQHP
jgi:MFS family permease